MLFKADGRVVFGSRAHIIELSVEDLCEEKIAPALQRLLLITVTVVLGLWFIASVFFFSAVFRFLCQGITLSFLLLRYYYMQCPQLLFALLYRQVHKSYLIPLMIDTFANCLCLSTGISKVTQNWLQIAAGYDNFEKQKKNCLTPQTFCSYLEMLYNIRGKINKWVEDLAS